MFQGSDISDTSSLSEEETQGNAEDPTLRRSRRDRKTPTPYEPYFEGERYEAQLFGMNMEDKMTTTKRLNSISVNATFDQVLNTDPA